MPYVYSTQTSGTTYTEYEKTPVTAASHIAKRQIHINGGANLAAVNNALFTPRGVVTKITDEEKEILLANPTFQRHMKLGFVHIEDSHRDVDKVVANMTEKDGSAPLTPKSPEVAGKKVVVENPPSKKGG